MIQMSDNIYGYYSNIPKIDITKPHITKPEIVGKGAGLTPMFNKLKGTVNYLDELKLINQSIYLILSTPIGTRFFLPEFGSKLHMLVFEPNDYIFEDLARIYISDALETWEKRLVIVDIVIDGHRTSDITDEGNTVNIDIIYRIANTNIEGNYVYPYSQEVYKLGSGGDTVNVY